MHFCSFQTKIALFLVTLSVCIGHTTSAICPAENDFLPCTCTYNSFSNNFTAYLHCGSSSSFDLNDARISEILKAFITTPKTAPLGRLELWTNKLTRIPDEIRLHPRLEYIYILQNEIKTIPIGAFNFSDKLNTTYLYLYNNQISSIEPGAFQGNFGNGSVIILNHNMLTRFEAGVFQSVLEKMEPYGGYPNAYVRIEFNPFDCVTDMCHLAWLIRDNRNLLKVVDGGTCSNSTTFEQLDPNGFKNCLPTTTALRFDN